MANERTIVNAGELIVHRPGKGWFRAAKPDQTLSRDCNILAVAKQDFATEGEVGAKYHDIAFAVIKRFFQDPRRNQVVDARTLAQQEELAKIHDEQHLTSHSMHNAKDTVAA